MIFSGFPRPIPSSGGGSFIKSIQRGETLNNSGVASFTAAISAVDLTKSVIIANTEAGSNQTPNGMLVRASFTSPTLITFNKGGAVAGNPTVTWQVIEFSSLKSLQTGTTTLLIANATITVPISTVNPSKCLTFCSFSNNSSSTTSGIQAAIAGMFLTNATTVTFSHAGGDTIFDWFVAELP